jgi:AcrR family transcriptional regulator
MAKKLGFTRGDVIAAAVALADETGIERLNLADVAKRLGVKPPSLYHHVGGIDGLRREIAMHGAASLRDVIAAATRGRRGKAALLAVAHAYRAFGRRHPGQLAAMLPAPRPSDDEELYRVMGGAVVEITRVLGELGVRGDDAIHVVRVFRSYLHGFADLEERGGFGMPQKLEKSFQRGLEVLLRGIDTR